MSTKFKKGDQVQVNSVIPQGAVEALRMDEDGNFYYLFSWTDINGVTQSRWFAENDLVAV